MLSAQIDKLRALADRMDGIVPNTPDELRDAADTIWQLRDDLQRTNAENAKLRELARNLWRVIPADVTGVVIGASTDHPTYYKFDEVFRETGVEV